MLRFKTILICLILMAPASVLAQSKLSYSLIINHSASADDEYDVCIFRINGGECLSMARSWKTSAMAAVNYRPNRRIRLQTGLAYNALSMDELNEAVGQNDFRVSYLSIPLRSHFFITQGKVSFYAGAGFRADIRIDSATEPTPEALILDNGDSFGMSAEVLLGLEVRLSQKLSISLEPTFSRGITPYDRQVNSGNINGLRLDLPMVVEFPQRIGFNFGLTFSPSGSID